MSNSQWAVFFRKKRASFCSSVPWLSCPRIRLKAHILSTALSVCCVWHSQQTAAFSLSWPGMRGLFSRWPEGFLIDSYSSERKALSACKASFECETPGDTGHIGFGWKCTQCLQKKSTKCADLREAFHSNAQGIYAGVCAGANLLGAAVSPRTLLTPKTTLYTALYKHCWSIVFYWCKGEGQLIVSGAHRIVYIALPSEDKWHKRKQHSNRDKESESGTLQRYIHWTIAVPLVHKVNVIMYL